MLPTREAPRCLTERGRAQRHRHWQGPCDSRVADPPHVSRAGVGSAIGFNDALPPCEMSARVAFAACAPLFTGFRTATRRALASVCVGGGGGDVSGHDRYHIRTETSRALESAGSGCASG